MAEFGLKSDKGRAKSVIRELSTRRKNGEFYTNYLVEDETDLKAISNAKMGDVAFVIHSSEHWMCDSQQTWYSINDKNKGPIQCECVDELTIWNDLKE